MILACDSRQSYGVDPISQTDSNISEFVVFELNNDCIHNFPYCCLPL